MNTTKHIKLVLKNDEPPPHYTMINSQFNNVLTNNNKGLWLPAGKNTGAPMSMQQARNIVSHIQREQRERNETASEYEIRPITP